MLRLLSAATLVCFGLIAGATAFAQDAKLPRFEVASIKLSTLSSTASQNDFSGTNVVFRNYVLGGILQTAFSVNRFNLEAPEWIFEERFDITAKVPDERANLDERRKMLQTLLIDRFGLAYHRETKMRAGFRLVVSKTGAKIQTVPDVGSHDNDNRAGRMQRLRTTIGDVASALSSILRQPVVDETHMEGLYNVVLTYAPDRGPNASPGDDVGPSIFTAIEEQLGLKLEAQRVPVDVFVVDHFDKMPVDN